MKPLKPRAGELSKVGHKAGPRRGEAGKDSISGTVQRRKQTSIGLRNRDLEDSNSVQLPNPYPPPLVISALAYKISPPGH